MPWTKCRDAEAVNTLRTYREARRIECGVKRVVEEEEEDEEGDDLDVNEDEDEDENEDEDEDEDEEEDEDEDEEELLPPLWLFNMRNQILLL